MDEKFGWKIYAPYFLGVSFALLLLFVWYLSALAIEESIVPVSVRLLFTGLFGLFTALAAAGLGYLFNSRLNDKKLEQDRLLDAERKEKAIILALQSNVFLLSSKYHQLKSFYDNCMLPYKDLPEDQRWYKLGAFLPNVELKPFNLINLIPIQEKLMGDLLNLDVLDQRYTISLRTLDSRSELHYKRFQKSLEDWLSTEETDNIDEFYDKYFPEHHKRLHRELIVSTNNCYEVIEETLISFNHMQMEILVFSKENYPNEVFFDLETILTKNIEP